MIDLGISKLALIGAVALVVIGPERLPKVARTVGALVGRAQRYINDVKAEVSREVELDELRKMRTEFEDAARDVERTIHKEVHEHGQALNDALTGTDSSTQEGQARPAATCHPGTRRTRPTTAARAGASSKARSPCGTSASTMYACGRNPAPRASSATVPPPVPPALSSSEHEGACPHAGTRPAIAVVRSDLRAVPLYRH